MSKEAFVQTWQIEQEAKALRYGRTIQSQSTGSKMIETLAAKTEGVTPYNIGSTRKSFREAEVNNVLVVKAGSELSPIQKRLLYDDIIALNRRLSGTDSGPFVVPEVPIFTPFFLKQHTFYKFSSAYYARELDFVVFRIRSQSNPDIEFVVWRTDYPSVAEVEARLYPHVLC